MSFLRSDLSSIDLGGAEIVAYDHDAARAAVITGGSTLAVVSYKKGFDKPKLLESFELPGDAQSVSIRPDGLIAVALSVNELNEGKVAFYKLKSGEVRKQGSVKVGNLPDSLAFSPNGSTLVVANEGEPNKFYGTEDGVNPKGSISIVKLNDGDPGRSRVKKLLFDDFTADELRSQGVRISGDSATPEFDIEPEYAVVSENGRHAFLTLQENNAIAKIDLVDKSVKRIFSTGEKSWAATPVDTNDDDAYQPLLRNFSGLRMPDGIDTFLYKGKEFVITANEGDSRVRPDDVNFEATGPDGTTYSYGTNQIVGSIDSFTDEITGATVYIYPVAGVGSSGDFEADEGDEFFMTLKYGASSDDDYYSDEIRSGKLDFGDAEILAEGRLKTVADQNDPVTGLKGFGGRSFSIFNRKGKLVYDSGSLLDEIASAAGFYDDGRSDDKSIEAESVVTARIKDRTFAFVALERAFDQSSPDELGSLIPVFEITNPFDPSYLGSFKSPQSLSPEGLCWVPGGTKSGHLLVANEVSGTLDAFRFSLGMA
jgi:DNA-binding beta-propeller fold protein YncE